VDPIEIVRRRQHAQRLTGEPFATAAEAVACLGAVQAQEHLEALWSLGTRVRDHDEAAVAAACDRGEILRTHVLRPTWHFVAAADLRWLLRLTGPRVLAKDAGRLRELGLDADTLARVHDVLAATLADGEPRTRVELAAALEAAAVDMRGQRIAHAIIHAELSGVLCSGPRRGAHHTYLPLDRVPPVPERSREDDVAELVLRYFSSHGPATQRDFAWWSGLTIGDAQTGLAAAGTRLVAEPDERGTPWIAAAHPPGESSPVRCGALLLGTYDETLVAYRDLRTVGPDGAPGSALLRRPIVLDGRTIGSWTRRRARREVVVEMALATPPGAGERAALQEAAERFGAFVGLPARLELARAA
jgi:winged helix DNA-binding protein